VIADVDGLAVHLDIRGGPTSSHRNVILDDGIYAPRPVAS